MAMCFVLGLIFGIVANFRQALLSSCAKDLGISPKLHLILCLTLSGDHVGRMNKLPSVKLGM